ncbi:MAG: DUF2202 domain-containing protein [Desulfamplus sp.]|nr:DUF2202 domain-containing protein [Desulfamplus sp.]
MKYNRNFNVFNGRVFSFAVAVFTIISLIIAVNNDASARGNQGKANGQGMAMTGMGVAGSYIEESINAMPYQEPDEEQIDGLIQMRLEEKLARDVYITLNGIWDIPIFANIAASEQRHMDAVKVLFDKYGIADPVVDDTVGLFSDGTSIELYEQFITKGGTTVEDALFVGATIEDMDIHDLNRLIEGTENEDMLTIYQNLVKGSRNHLRAFTKLLARYDITYEAQFISTEELEGIISSGMELGGHNRNRGVGPRMGKNGTSDNGMGRGGINRGAMDNFIDEDGDGVCDLLQ